LERVTEISRAMVTRWGMSDKLGPMTFGRKEELVFLGKEIGEQRDFSESVAQEIDAEVRVLVQEAHETARRVLTEKRDILNRIAKRLLEVETLDMVQFEALYTGKEPPSEPPAESSTPSSPKPAPERPSPVPPTRTPSPVPGGA